ncbi:hypothetical protein RCCS2_01269 [Roseobacter sp. CCS2]|nr:hypothetical protein RCCS2_01269 [Roseobacter sp. CCS2]
MHGVFADGQCEFLADCARCGVGWVGCTHDFAVLCNRVFAFENLNNDWLGNHEFAQLIKERTFRMHTVELLRLCQCQLDALGGHDAQTCVFEFGRDLACQITLCGVGFDDGKSTLNSHVEPLGFKGGTRPDALMAAPYHADFHMKSRDLPMIRVIV